MAYNLLITEHADEQLDHVLHYLIDRLKNEQAARHLIDEMNRIYDRLEENPFQFPLSKDIHLANKGYHEAVVSQMNYIVIFGIKRDVVNVVGIFHQMENYQKKL